MTEQAAGSSSRPRAEYERDAAAYLQRVASLFGAYKKRSFDFLKLQPGLRVLDAGCGTGEDAAAMAALVQPGGRVTGLDLSADLIKAARLKAGEGTLPVDFVSGDIEHIPFEDHTFHRARADRVFQHLRRRDEALAELRRVTAPGGWIVLLDVDWSTLIVNATDLGLTRRILNFLVDTQVAPQAGRSLAGALRKAGLADVECYPEAVLLERLAAANLIWGLEAYARKAAGGGAATGAEADAWLADLAERDANGTFFASITGFVARGRTPG
jgi:ubiquinone/menaquinone biosynthesis C-methylase UbiE